MIKIGHILWRMPNAGLENMVCDLASIQSSEKEVWVIVVNGEIDPKILSRIDKRIRLLELNRRHRFCINILNLVKLIFLRVDVMHIHDINLKVFRFIMPFVRRWYCTIHNTNINGNRRGLDAISYVSNSIELEWRSRDSVNLISRVIYNGVDTKGIRDYFVPTNNRKPYNLVQIGRIDFAQKGQDIAIGALEILPEKYSLTFIGNGDDRNRLEQLIVENNLGNRSTIVENMARHDLYEYLKTFQVCIMPSRFEGFGLIAVEAYLLGMKVIVSDVDGLREVSDIIGELHLVEKDCPRCLAESILGVGNMNEKNEDIEKFELTINACSESHSEIYEALCE